MTDEAIEPHDDRSPPDAGACSVVIPTIGRWELVDRVLDAIQAQTFQPVEVIVVVDGTSDDAPERFALMPPVRILRLRKSSGPGAARNAGAAQARGKIFAFIDDDMIPEPGYIAAHMKHHVRAGTAGVVVCGRIVEEYLSSPASRLDRWLRARRDGILSTALGAIESGELPSRAYVTCGASCSVTRETFEAAGGFDEDLCDVHEDADLGLRLLDRGVPFVVERSAIVRHQNRKDLRAAFIAGNTAAARADVRLAREGRLAPPHAVRLARVARRSPSSSLANAAAVVPRASSAPEASLEWLANLTGSTRPAEAWRSVAGYRAYLAGLSSEGETPQSAARLVQSGPRVLTFHSVGEPDTGDGRRFSLSPKKLRELCAALESHSLRGVTLTTALRSPGDPGHIALTFDDGYEDFFHFAAPILHEFGFSATVYIVADPIGGMNTWDSGRGRKARRLLSARQLLELVDQGFEIGSHSLTHAWLPDLTLAELERELRSSRAILEQTVSRSVVSFAYPSGGVNVRVRNAVREAGYDSAVTALDGPNIPLDPFAIERWQVDRDHSVRGVMRTVVSGADHRSPMTTTLMHSGRRALGRIRAVR